MSESRKRSRKSKLQIRETDYEFEIVSEPNDKNTPVQKVSKIAQIKYKTVPVTNDHDYCQGSGGFALSIQPYSIKKEEVDLELDKVHKIKHLTEKRLLSSYFKRMSSKKKKGDIVKTENGIKVTEYDPQQMMSVSKLISSTSDNPADKILDIEMRNLWGHVLHTPHVVDSHENLLQMTLELWQKLNQSSRVSRDTPLFYQCHICHLAWWRLQPFREHIKTHNIETLIISLKENLQECMIIASTEPVMNLKFIDIEDDCWRCGKDFNFHTKASEYKCVRCKRLHYTCSALREHESKCFYSNISVHNISAERQCTICSVFIDSIDLVEKHMVSAHSVRSDEIVPIILKPCTICDGKYICFKLHNCSKRAKNIPCNYCCRKFTLSLLAIEHMALDGNQAILCKICAKVIPRRCQELEHVLTHSQNYCLALKCSLCMDKCKLFLHEKDIKAHKINWHKRKTDPKRSYVDMMLLPTQCIEGTELVEEPFDETDYTSSTQNNHDEIETESIQVLSADIDVIVDEVDIKKEHVYDENGEIDYELMLRNMFSDTTSQDNDENVDVDGDIDIDDLKKKLVNVNDQRLSPSSGHEKPNSPKIDVNIEIKKEIDAVQIKTEPKDNIDIEETPIEIGIVKSEPIDFDDPDNDNGINENRDCMDSEYPDYQNKIDIQNHNDMNCDDQNDCTNNGNQNKDIDNRNEDDTEGIDNYNLDVENEIVVSEDHSMNIDNQISEKNKEHANESRKDNEIDTLTVKIEPSMNIDNQTSEKNKELTNESRKDNEIDTLTVKIEPGVNLEDITSDDIVIKPEPDSDDESNDLIHFDLLNDTVDFNPDELSVDVVSPNGIYKKKKMYACSKCGYTAKYKHYRNHIMSQCAISPGLNNSYNCTKCDLTFVSFRDYVLHFDSHGYDLMRCPKCGEHFEYLHKLISHIQRHIKYNFVLIHVLNKGGKESNKTNKEFQCQDCRVVVPNADIFRHWEAHLSLDPQDTSSSSLECKVKEEKPELSVDCERLTENNKKLDAATLKLALVHLQSTVFVDKICAVCYRAFSRRCDVKRHIVEHLLMDAHVQKAQHYGFRCQICFETFARPEVYKFHMREHGSMPIFKCELCNKTFSDSSNFSKHKKTHNVRVMECDMCRKKFHSKNALQKHILEHNNGTKIECVHCPATFNTRGEYKRHRYQHVKNKFKCVLCDVSFPALQQKWDHDWQVHKERKFKADCPICHKKFRKLQDVRIHAKKEHSASVKLMKHVKTTPNR